MLYCTGQDSKRSHFLTSDCGNLALDSDVVTEQGLLFLWETSEISQVPEDLARQETATHQ